MLINKECRICLQDTNTKFLSPCFCSGTSKYVHEDCLHIWRTTCLNREAYKRCMECKGEYQTIKLHKLETYKIFFFDVNNRRRIANEFFVFMTGMITISLILTLNDIQIDVFGDQRLIKLLKKYKPLNFCYNYSLGSFFILFVASLIFYQKCYSNIKRREKYYELIGGELIGFFLGNAHFVFLYLIIGFACDDPGIFIMVEQLISTFSLFSNVLMYKRHNNVLKIINNEFNFDIVIDYTPNINENTIIDITD